jgi:pimeloyl-ACP methyl ester carboxylesterase
MTQRRHAAGVNLYVEEGGTGSPTLILLHGLGANGDAWNPMLKLVRERWKGSWMVPDLRGHGRSGHAPPYDLATYAADIASLIAATPHPVIVGHSLGGATGMVLASGWFGVRPRCVVAFGVKVAWTDEEMARREKLSSAPVKWFDRRDEAIDRYLKVSGLFGLVDPTAQEAASGIREENGRFRLAADPGINNMNNPSIRTIAAAMTVPVHIGVGAKDPIVSVDDARILDRNAVVFEETAHNAHVERPDLVWDLVEKTVVAASG